MLISFFEVFEGCCWDFRAVSSFSRSNRLLPCFSFLFLTIMSRFLLSGFEPLRELSLGLLLVRLDGLKWGLLFFDLWREGKVFGWR